MKTRSALLHSLGALALLVLAAFPSSSALASPGCGDPDVYYEYGGPTGLQVEMETDTPIPCTPCSGNFTPIIFYTTNGQNPTHTGSTPGSGTMIYYGPIPIPLYQWRYFRAITYKGCCSYQDSGVTYFDISNPVQ